jgi:hypothetical protein
LVKSELGKVRLAVASDLASYLRMKWLMDRVGGVYLQWEDNTLEESGREELQRMADTLDRLVGAYSLAFDFAEFDHQPLTSDVVDIVSQYWRRGFINVPVDGIDEWERIFDECVESFSNATLSLPASIAKRTKDLVLKVVGGVMSGLGVTSFLGNSWNMVLTNGLKDLLDRGGFGNPFSKVRGDDTTLIHRCFWTLLLQRIGYAAVNAQGTDGKFGIHAEQTEFLRQWYAEDRVWGYPNRAIPGLTQRKPWSNEPWDPYGTVKAQFGVLRTLERRVGRLLPRIEDVLSVVWAKVTKQTARWLRVPVSMGGLGLREWDGWLPSGRLKSFEAPIIDVTPVAKDAALRLQAGFSFQVTLEEAAELHKRRVSAKLASDDVRGVSHIFRDRFKEEGWPAVVWSRVPTRPNLTIEEAAVLDLYVARLRSIRRPADLDLGGAEGFGKYRSVVGVLRDAQELSRVRAVKPLDLIAPIAPTFRSELQRLEKKGITRTWAMGWLLGDLPAPVLYSNPKLAAAVSAAVANWCATRLSQKQHSWDLKLEYVTRTLDRAFASSPLHDRLLTT